MKLSQYPLKTFKEDPHDATSISHKLMLRAGFIRSLASGVYIQLPPLVRVLHKVESIVRQEMDQSGAIELHLPTLSPRNLWEQTGRWDDYTRNNNLLYLQDRKGATLVLGPTHEEVITWLIANELSSYKDLPVNFYQITAKFRDEARPRGGLNRTREFSMKDAYSFDVDSASADLSYEKMRLAYLRIFERCGLDVVAVEADSGAIGGTGSQEFILPSKNGDDRIITCQSCSYAANIETAESKLMTSPQAEEDQESHLEHTPNIKTVAELADFFNISADQMVKTVLYEVSLKGSDDLVVVAVLMRGDLDINEVKLSKAVAKVLGGTVSEVVVANKQLVKDVTGAEVGFAGPVKLPKDIYLMADLSVQPLKNFLCGINKTDYHLLDVNIGRDFAEPKYFDLREVKEGDDCARCDDGKLEITLGVELGHIFKLGTKYSQQPTSTDPTGLSATYLDKEGQTKPMFMGCYGIGITRIAVGAVESLHDDKGMVWPLSLAPWQVVIVVVRTDNDLQMKASLELYQSLQKSGIEVVLDDRTERMGFKLSDADLIGYPFQIIVGKHISEGQVEVKRRVDGQVSLIKVTEVAKHLAQTIKPEVLV